MARSVVDTKIYGDPAGVENEDSVFALMSCTYVFSYMALTAFASAQLHKLWDADSSRLRQEYPESTDFEALMKGPLKELKAALKELALQRKVSPLHMAKPRVWQELTEFVKIYRDYFVHPNPERFHEHVEGVGNLQYGFPSRVAVEIIAYFFGATGAATPAWLEQA